MRYIYYIILILLALSAVLGYELRSKSSAPKESAIIVNKKVISIEEFNRLYSSRSADLGDKNDFINSLITKELLIQESQKDGIDKEEAFRRSIRNFYEQSLIKILMDRKCACLNISVTDDELNRYVALLGAKIHFTMFSFDSVDKALKGDYRDGESRSVYFEDLSRDMRNSIMALKERQMTEPLRTGEKYVVIRLDRIDSVPSLAPSAIEKDKIREMLKEGKKERILNDWIAELREKASIKILLDGKH